jgi:non-ribosomal peptide synthetase-like protein
MAKFCARVRKQPDLPAVSIKDIYQNPTISALAAALAPAEEATAQVQVQERLAGVLAGVLGIEQVAVGDDFFQDLGADSLVMAKFCARVRKQPDLPPVSIKDVYQHPTISGLATALAPPPAAEPAANKLVEAGLAAVLAEVLEVDSVAPDSHVFDDLGADSMVLARFCARVRKREGLPAVSIKDVYQHPTIGALAAALASPAAAVVPAPVATPTAEAGEEPVEAPRPRPASAAQHVLCGVLQTLVFVLYCLGAASVAIAGYDWISDGGGLVQDYLRAVVVAGGAFLGMSVLPVLVKWLLIGRWKAEEFPVWTMRYVRFWIVKTLVQKNPAMLICTGTPLYTLYLRALGADIGRGVAIFAKQVPVCTDLLTIGAGTVLRKDVLLSCYRAHDGLIQTGRVTLGADVVIGEGAVIDIRTSMADGAQLGHRSSLQEGQAVPAGQRWHGSPAERTDVDYTLVPPARVSTRRRVVYSTLVVLNLLLVSLPILTGGTSLLVVAMPGLEEVLQVGPATLTQSSFYLSVAAASALLFFGGIVVTFLAVVTVPRVMHLFITPGKVYPLYGLHYSMHRGVSRLTNAKFLAVVLGNSSWIVHYLKCLGYDLQRVVQTGSNFGMVVKHEDPYLTTIGSGTVIADGLSVMNGDHSSTSFRVTRTEIGADNFLGNAIHYPAQGRTGDNCLLATKVMVPIDGPVREGVGLLGSPPFEIPRSVERDSALGAHLRDPAELARRLRAKNRHNAATIALFLFVRWVNFFVLTLVSYTALQATERYGSWPLAMALVVDVVLATAIGVLAERAVTGFRRLTPQQCSIYDPYFWYHERFWKMTSQPAFFNGTPLKPLAWRLAGVRIGRRVFDDGAGMPERTMVTIGDDCTLNAGSAIQCHSQEDAGFKSDRIVIGSGVTLGVGSWVHYGVTMGDGSELAPDAFLMKGSEVSPGARWGGNPAVELTPAPAALPAPDPRPDTRDEPTTQSEEDLMDLFQGDSTPGASLPVPLPRRSGQHRAHQRHLAGSR